MLQTLTPKRLLAAVKDAVEGLHGDYGLACVLHSISGKIPRPDLFIRLPEEDVAWECRPHPPRKSTNTNFFRPPSSVKLSV